MLIVHQHLVTIKAKQIKACLLLASKERSGFLFHAKQGDGYCCIVQGNSARCCRYMWLLMLIEYLSALAKLHNYPFNMQQLFCVSCVRLEALHVRMQRKILSFFVL